jgi:hypothetical protein
MLLFEAMRSGTGGKVRETGDEIAALSPGVDRLLIVFNDSRTLARPIETANSSVCNVFIFTYSLDKSTSFSDNIL